MDCITCGYCYADVNEDGEPESLEYCHFEGPEGWAPCEYVEYDGYDGYAELAEMEQAIYDEDYRSSVEYYGEPYDYQEF